MDGQITTYNGETGEVVAATPQTALAQIVANETEQQLLAAHRFPRSASKAVREATALATHSESIATSCMYTVDRGDGKVTGPSVRCAEICASAWGNLRVAAEVVDVAEKEIVARGVCWDLETNLQAAATVRRRITKKNGARYSDDMITLTGNAACAIARRNAILQVVPRALVDDVYESAKAVGTGEGKPMAERCKTVLATFAKMGVSADRVLAKLGHAGASDITIDDLVMLTGLRTAIKEGLAINEAFPIVADLGAIEEGKRTKLRPREQAAPATATTQATPPASKPKPAPKSAPAATAMSEAPHNDPLSYAAFAIVYAQIEVEDLPSAIVDQLADVYGLHAADRWAEIPPFNRRQILAAINGVINRRKS